MPKSVTSNLTLPAAPPNFAVAPPPPTRPLMHRHPHPRWLSRLSPRCFFYVRRCSLSEPSPPTRSETYEAKRQKQATAATCEESEKREATRPRRRRRIRRCPTSPLDLPGTFQGAGRARRLRSTLGVSRLWRMTSVSDHVQLVTTKTKKEQSKTEFVEVDVLHTRGLVPSLLGTNSHVPICGLREALLTHHFQPGDVPQRHFLHRIHGASVVRIVCGVASQPMVRARGIFQLLCNQFAKSALEDKPMNVGAESQVEEEG